MKHSIYFEPKEPITNKGEFTKELIDFCEENSKELVILHEGMEPIVLVDGVKYLCMLEPPHIATLPFLPTIYYSSSYGFKYVYLYKYENLEKKDS